MATTDFANLLQDKVRQLEMHEDWRLIAGACLFAIGCGLPLLIQLGANAWIIGLLLASVMACTSLLATPSWNSHLFLGLFVAAGVTTGDYHKRKLPQVEIERETFLTVAGHVQGVEHRINAPLRLTVTVAQVDKLEGLIGETIQVSVRTAFPEDLLTGDAIVFSSVLKPNSGPMVPGGFDFGRNQKLKGIAARGFAVSPISISSELEATTSFFTELANYRNQLSARILSSLEQPVSGVAVALITGQRQHLDRATANILRDAGLAHLLAISGLHMGLITGVAFFLLEFLLAAVPALALRIPVRKLAAAGAWLTAIIYLMLSGAGVSTIRAFVMVSVALLAVVTDRRVLSLRSVALAAIAILAITPQAIFSISFQMSFAATIGLIVFYENVSRRKLAAANSSTGAISHTWLARFGTFVAATALTSLVAQIAIAPIALYHFQALSLIGIIANVLAVPLMGFLVMPAAFLALLLIPLGLDSLLLSLMGLGLEWIITLSAFLIEFPLSVLRAGPFHSELMLVTFLLFGALMLIRHSYVPSFVAIAFAVIVVLMQKPAATILIDNEGRIIAAKTDDQTFNIVGGRRGGFRDEIWMRYWNLPLASSSKKLDRVCTSRGCSTRLPSTNNYRSIPQIVRSFSLDSVRKACDAQNIVIAPYDYRRHCRNAAVFLSIEDIASAGPVGIYFDTTEPQKMRAEFSSPHKLFSNRNSNAAPQ